MAGNSSPINPDDAQKIATALSKLVGSQEELNIAAQAYEAIVQHQLKAVTKISDELSETNKLLSKEKKNSALASNYSS